MFSWFHGHHDSPNLKKAKEEGHELNAKYEELLQKKEDLAEVEVEKKREVLEAYTDLVHAEKSKLDHIRLKKLNCEREVQYMRLRREQVRAEQSFLRGYMNQLAREANDLRMLEQEMEENLGDAKSEVDPSKLE